MKSARKLRKKKTFEKNEDVEKLLPLDDVMMEMEKAKEEYVPQKSLYEEYFERFIKDKDELGIRKERQFYIYCVNALLDNDLLNEGDLLNCLKGFLCDLIHDYFDNYIPLTDKKEWVDTDYKVEE